MRGIFVLFVFDDGGMSLLGCIFGAFGWEGKGRKEEHFLFLVGYPVERSKSVFLDEMHQ